MGAAPISPGVDPSAGVACADSSPKRISNQTSTTKYLQPNISNQTPTTRRGRNMLVALRRMTFLPSRKAIAGVLLGLIGGAPMAIAGNFVEPTVFASSRGALDLLVIAKTKPVPTIALPSPDGDIHPTGWVYEICRRPAYGNGNVCPAGAAVADYG